MKNFRAVAKSYTGADEKHEINFRCMALILFFDDLNLQILLYIILKACLWMTQNLFASNIRLEVFLMAYRAASSDFSRCWIVLLNMICDFSVPTKTENLY